jgi:hypothetical protein
MSQISYLNLLHEEFSPHFLIMLRNLQIPPLFTIFHAVQAYHEFPLHGSFYSLRNVSQRPFNVDLINRDIAHVYFPPWFPEDDEPFYLLYLALYATIVVFP